MASAAVLAFIPEAADNSTVGRAFASIEAALSFSFAYMVTASVTFLVYVPNSFAMFNDCCFNELSEASVILLMVILTNVIA